MLRGWIAVGVDWTLKVGVFLAASVLVLWVTGRLLPLVAGAAYARAKCVPPLRDSALMVLVAAYLVRGSESGARSLVETKRAPQGAFGILRVGYILAGTFAIAVALKGCFWPT